MSPAEAVKRRIQGVSSPGYHILAPGSSFVERSSPSVKLKLIMDSMGRESWTKPFSTYLPFYVWVSLLRTNNQVSETKTTLKHLLRSLPNFLLQKWSNKIFFSPEWPRKQEGNLNLVLALLPGSTAVDRARHSLSHYFIYSLTHVTSINKLVIFPKRFASEFQHNQGDQIKRTTVMKSTLSLICWNKQSNLLSYVWVEVLANRILLSLPYNDMY